MRTFFVVLLAVIMVTSSSCASAPRGVPVPEETVDEVAGYRKQLEAALAAAVSSLEQCRARKVTASEEIKRAFELRKAVQRSLADAIASGEPEEVCQRMAVILASAEDNLSRFQEIQAALEELQGHILATMEEAEALLATNPGR